MYKILEYRFRCYTVLRVTDPKQTYTPIFPPNRSVLRSEGTNSPGKFTRQLEKDIQSNVFYSVSQNATITKEGGFLPPPPTR